MAFMQRIKHQSLPRQSWECRLGGRAINLQSNEEMIRRNVELGQFYIQILIVYNYEEEEDDDDNDDQAYFVH
jgi:hypothetical protein